MKILNLNASGLRDHEHLSVPFITAYFATCHLDPNSDSYASAQFNYCINANTAKELRALANQVELAWMEYERRSKKEVA